MSDWRETGVTQRTHVEGGRFIGPYRPVVGGTEEFVMPDGATVVAGDENGDGLWESLASDFDGDGQPEVGLIDTDLDGRFDVVDGAAW